MICPKCASSITISCDMSLEGVLICSTYSDPLNRCDWIWWINANPKVMEKINEFIKKLPQQLLWEESK